MNLHHPTWDAEVDAGGGARLRAVRLAKRAGSVRLAASLYELEPGAVVSPLHFHHHNEELLFVLSGTPALRRSDDDLRDLAPGEVVAFPPTLSASTKSSIAPRPRLEYSSAPRTTSRRSPSNRRTRCLQSLPRRGCASSPTRHTSAFPDPPALRDNTADEALTPSLRAAHTRCLVCARKMHVAGRKEVRATRATHPGLVPFWYEQTDRGSLAR